MFRDLFKCVKTANKDVTLIFRHSNFLEYQKVLIFIYLENDLLGIFQTHFCDWMGNVIFMIL